eukprot:2406605-Amphidinium_carterae.1
MSPGGAQPQITKLQDVTADSKSRFNVEARVSFVGLSCKTQNGRPCRKFELTEGDVTLSLTVLGEANIAA